MTKPIARRRGLDAPPGRTIIAASVATLALPIGYPVILITGTTNITGIAATGHAGRPITLILRTF